MLVVTPVVNILISLSIVTTTSYAQIDPALSQLSLIDQDYPWNLPTAIILAVMLIHIIQYISIELLENVCCISGFTLSDRTTTFIAKYIVIFIFSFSICHLLITGQFEVLSMIPKTPVAPFFIAVLEISLITALRSSIHSSRLQYEWKLNCLTAEHYALKAKLKPHFLFNTLNLIAQEVEDNPSNAVKLICDLSDLYRKLTKVSTKTLISISDEVELVINYLDIQKQRLDDNLEFNITVQDDTKSLLIPALLLQPLVENSICHGMIGLQKALKITIDIYLIRGSVIMEVNDNGCGFCLNNQQLGQGTTIIRDTLKLIYNQNYSFDIRSSSDAGTLVSITVPKTSELNEYADHR